MPDPNQNSLNYQDTRDPGMMDWLTAEDSRLGYQDRLGQYLQQYGNRQGPQAGQANQAATSGFRNNQSAMIGRLEAMSQGQGPSLAAQQLKMATDRNQSMQAGMAASGRGNAGMAGIQASNMSGVLGAQAAGQSAQARIQEQQMALQQLGGALQAGRQGDEQNSQFNAQQQNFRDQANLEAKLRTMGMNDAQVSAILAQMGGAVAQPTTGEKAAAGAATLAGAFIGSK